VINYILVPLFSLLLIVFQMMIADILFSGNIGVELSLILVIYAGFRLDVIRGGCLSFIIGFMRDCITCSISGFYALLYVFIFLISLTASSRISAGKPVIIMIFTLICALLEGMLVIVIHPLLYGGDISSHALKVYLPQAFIVSGLSPLLFKVFNRIEVILNGRATQPVERT
jgi:cell shape-determining protein MreD